MTTRSGHLCSPCLKEVSSDPWLWNHERSETGRNTDADDRQRVVRDRTGESGDDFVETSITLSIALASAEIGALLTDKLRPLAAWLMTKGEQFGAPADAIEDLRSNQKYLDMLKPDLAKAVRYSLVVIGACSAIEAFLEQFVKNRIRDEPSALDGTLFDSRTIAQQKCLTDPADVLEEQWRAIKRSPTKGLRRSDEKLPPHDSYEMMLNAVAREGRTPPMVERDLNSAYIIRNVWAHNAGYADNTFIAKAPSELTVPLGQLVTLSRQDAQRYLSVILTYGMIVANRERAVHGLGPIPMAGKPGDTEWSQAYHSLYT